MVGAGLGRIRKPMTQRIERILGGSPGSVLLRLLFLSLLVGAGMAFLGVSPVGLVRGLADAARHFFESGFAALGEVGWWLATGAIIVIPLFILSRLLSGRR